MNTLSVLIDILDCPPGFQLSQTQPAFYICTDRLQQFTNTCLVDDKIVLREHNAQFWVGYDNHSRGVILHPHCPFDYCTSEETHLAVDDGDKQCNYNRSGLLCGRCSENLSLALGNSRCLQCSNSYIALLGSYICFSWHCPSSRPSDPEADSCSWNHQWIDPLCKCCNRELSNIFPDSSLYSDPTMLIAKVLTVLIAWLNFDLGIETCFYNGMDAYVKIWLQFAFPLYIWVVVGMIIIGSHYLGKVARLFGSNPIAVLATLFLLSYAKLLRTVIAALSYTFRPNN